MKEKNALFLLDKFVRSTIAFYISILFFLKGGVKKYWVYNLSIILVFVSFFYYQSLGVKTYYHAKSSYTFNYLHKKVFGDLLYDIEQLVKNKEIESLSKLLQISPEVVETVLSLSAKNIVGGPLHEDFTNKQVPFYIHATFSAKGYESVIQGAITNYLNTDDYIVEKQVEKEEQLLKNYGRIKAELLVLDSLVTLNSSKNAVEELDKVFDIRAQKVKEEIELKKLIESKAKGVTLLKPFVSIEVHRNTLLKKMLFSYGVLGIMLSLSVSTFLFWYKHPTHEF